MKNFDIIRLKSVDSTNDFAKEHINTFNKKNCIIISEEQTSGRGQRGNCWFSEANKNLTCSIIVFPENFEIDKQFFISKITAVSIINVLNSFNPGFKIKWPNDIYFRKEKIGGVLIENSISGKIIQNSIIGIGINLNQEIFDQNLKNPISLKKIINKNIDIAVFRDMLLQEFNKVYKNLENKQFKVINSLYERELFGLHVISSYRDKSGEFKGIMTGVENSGRLIIRKDTNEIKKYDFKEVVFL